MQRILIVCPNCHERTIYPVCKAVYMIAVYLSKRYDVTVIAKDSNNYKYDGDRPFRLEQLTDSYKVYWDTMLNLDSANPIKRLYANLKFKGLTPSFSFNSLRKWSKEHSKEHYDVVISVSHPFYTHKMAQMLLRKLSIKKWIAYFVDPYSDNKLDNGSIKKRVKNECLIFKKCTNIFATKLMYEQSKNSRIKDYIDKLYFIPDTVIYDRTNYNVKSNSEKIICNYMGQFIKTIRNPERLMRIFAYLTDKYEINFFYRECEEIIGKYTGKLAATLNENSFVRDFEAFNRIIGGSDILISLGNSINNQSPSKIYEYCSFGKPIVHFYQNKEDSILNTFANYPLIKFIDYNAEPQKAAEELMQFVEINYGKSVDYETIRDLFPNCTLDYVAGLIEDVINK